MVLGLRRVQYDRTEKSVIEESFEDRPTADDDSEHQVDDRAVGDCELVELRAAEVHVVLCDPRDQCVRYTLPSESGCVDCAVRLDAERRLIVVEVEPSQEEADT